MVEDGLARKVGSWDGRKRDLDQIKTKGCIKKGWNGLMSLGGRRKVWYFFFFRRQRTRANSGWNTVVSNGCRCRLGANLVVVWPSNGIGNSRKRWRRREIERGRNFETISKIEMENLFSDAGIVSAMMMTKSLGDDDNVPRWRWRYWLCHSKLERDFSQKNFVSRFLLLLLLFLLIFPPQGRWRETFNFFFFSTTK